MKFKGGQFKPKLPGHFELELGGQYHWNLQADPLVDRKVIGWSLSHTMYAKDTSIAAFKMALINRPLKRTDSLIFHSDRGVQYACKEFCIEVSRCKVITRSMSRKGNCWDNAVAESFFKTLKVELVYQHRYETRKEAELSIFEYIEGFYNTHRRHKYLKNRTILEYHKLINNNFKIVAYGIKKFVHFLVGIPLCSYAVQNTPCLYSYILPYSSWEMIFDSFM